MLQLREQRKEDLERHVTEVNAELRKQNLDVGEGSDDGASGSEEGEVGWEGIAEAEPAEGLPEDEEYVDEDKYTTVTVEAMDGEDEGAVEDGDEFAVKATGPVPGGAEAKAGAKKRIWKKDGQAKAKKKKFRYESKAERQATRQKQKSKNHKAKLRREGK